MALKFRGKEIFNAPYDGYDESDDTREKARTVRLEKAVPVKC